MEDTFRYPFRSRSHSPVSPVAVPRSPGRDSKARQAGSTSHSNRTVAERASTSQSVRSISRARSEVSPPKQQSTDRSISRRERYEDTTPSKRNISRPVSTTEHERRHTSQEEVFDTPTRPTPRRSPHSSPQLLRDPHSQIPQHVQSQLQPYLHPPQINANNDPQLVFSQAMQAMQAMSAMMMQFSSTVPNANAQVPSFDSPVSTPSSSRVPARIEEGRSQWSQPRETGRGKSAMRRPLEWSEQDSEFGLPSSSSSSPVRYPPPSSSPSSTHELDHDHDRSYQHTRDSFSERSHSHRSSSSSPRKGTFTNIHHPNTSSTKYQSSNTPTTPRLPPALRSSSPTSSSRSRSQPRIRKRVSFELKSYEQVISISSDEEDDRGDGHHERYTHKEVVTQHTEDDWEATGRRHSRASTPAPAERPRSRQVSRTRLGTPALPRSGPSHQYSSQHRSPQRWY